MVPLEVNGTRTPSKAGKSRPDGQLSQENWFCCKDYFETKLDLKVSLPCSNLEQALDKLCLPHRVTPV
jgi:hypothetical protein